jgi:hypothetical protein
MGAWHHNGENEGVDQEQQQRVDERPDETERRATIARLQVARDEALNERAIAKELCEVFDRSAIMRECGRGLPPVAE